jgi:hypothetical protein
MARLRLVVHLKNGRAISKHSGIIFLSRGKK